MQLATTDQQQPAAPKLPTVDKPKRTPRIGRKLFAAIELIVFNGADLQDAATQSGLTTFQLRQAFGRPHVIAHLKERREVLRAAASGKNILRLCQIRDAADNMPAVNAIKVLEQLGDGDAPGRSGVSHSPGLTIQILNVAPNVTGNATRQVLDQEPDGQGNG